MDLPLLRQDETCGGHGNADNDGCVQRLAKNDDGGRGCYRGNEIDVCGGYPRLRYFTETPHVTKCAADVTTPRKSRFKSLPFEDRLDQNSQAVDDKCCGHDEDEALSFCVDQWFSMRIV